MRSSRGTIVLAGALLGLAGTGPAALPAGTEAWRRAGPDHAWRFPRDHWAHPEYRTEWWYLTGLVADSTRTPPRPLGFQLTFFRVGFSPERPAFASAWAARGLVLAHAAVTDPAAGTHRFVDVVCREIPLLGGFPEPGDPRLAWCRGPAGTEDPWTLAWTGEGFALHAGSADLGIDLTARPLKPLVFQGPGGVSRKGTAPGAASLYYSFTRLAASGTLRLGDRTVPVRGTCWMDKEFGSNALGDAQVGWDWFSLVLDDGREVMLYLLRREDGAIDHASGTLVAADGRPTYLEPEDWRLEATDRWTSPHTGAVYPSAWTLELPAAGIRGRIRPLLADQENVPRRSRSPAYWEGGVELTGDGGGILGRGYAELTGYAPGARPAW